MNRVLSCAEGQPMDGPHGSHHPRDSYPDESYGDEVGYPSAPIEPAPYLPAPHTPAPYLPAPHTPAPYPSAPTRPAPVPTGPSLRSSQRVILDILRAVGPLTDEDIHAYLEGTMTASGARTRRHELVLAGLVRDSGQRRRSPNNRPVTLWEAVPA